LRKGIHQFEATMTQQATRRDDTAKTRWDRTEFVVLALILAASFLVRLPFRDVPLIRDEGEYAHLGQDILRGQIPYRDVYNQKTPFTFLFFAAVQAVCGTSVPAIRIATSLYGLATTIVLYALARRLFGRAAAVATATAFAVMTFDQAGIAHQSSTEFFMLLWIGVGLLLWYEGRLRGKSWMVLTTGIAAALCYLCKQTGAVLLIFFCADAVWSRLRNTAAPKDGSRPPSGDPPRNADSLARPGGPRSAARSAASALSLRGWQPVISDIFLMTAGFVIAQAAVIGFFAWHRALSAYLECTWWNNFAYISHRHRGLAKALEELITYDARYDIGLWIAGTLALVTLAWRQRDHRGNGLWILLFGTACAGLSTGSRYIHYYEPMIVPLSLGAGLATSWLFQQAMRPGRTASALVFLILLGVIPWIWPAYNIASCLANTDGVVMREGLAQFIDAESAARYIKEHTDPGEPILILGSEPEIHYLSERPSCTRLVITYPLIGPYPYSDGLRKEFFRDFEHNRPRYVIYCNDAGSITEWGKDAAMVFLWEPSGRFLDRYYDLVKEITYQQKTKLFLIYRRKGS
jgi:hypothetical protein